MLVFLIKKLAILCVTIFTKMVILAIITYKPLPNNSPEIKQTHPDIDPNSSLAKYFISLINQQPELTGIYLLNNRQDAFLAASRASTLKKLILSLCVIFNLLFIGVKV